MNLVSKICVLIILMCTGGILYVSYNFIKLMGPIGIANPGKLIKEMMLFSVYIVLFGLIISTSIKIHIKQSEYAREDKWSAETPIPGVA